MKNPANDPICPLCSYDKVIFFSKDKKREYLKCTNCSLIFVPECYYITEEEEKKRYELHKNSESDTHYINFLERIVPPVLSNLRTAHNNVKGLDFGCGPGPVLKKIFLKHGISIDEYDIYFKKDSYLLNKKWDFIISTEVIEHISRPTSLISSLWDMLNNKGLLVLMTQLYNDEIEFKSWYYKGDPTHITFFSRETFIWLSKKIDAHVEFFDKDIIIFKKNNYIDYKEL